MKTRLGIAQTILTGKALPYSRPGSFSAIDKHAVHKPVQVQTGGLQGDEQGDTKIHGGIDKAVHSYPFEHYQYWINEIGEIPILKCPGAFGENLSTLGMTEHDICLADIVKIGNTLLEVTQGRQPCWKLNDRFGVPDMAKRVQQTIRTGWYFKVLEPGAISPGDSITLYSRRYPHWSIERLMSTIRDRCLDPKILEEILRLPLVESWQRLIEKRLRHAVVEDWSPRLDGRRNN